jgi:hypothetical protein
VLVTGLTRGCLLWDLPWGSFLSRVSLDRVGYGQFLAGLEVFCFASCWVFLPYRLCFGGVFVPGPREVTEGLWSISCAAAVAIGQTGSVHRSNRCHRSDRRWPSSDRCSTGSKPCKFPLCVLVSFGSEGCLLVPRVSSPPVATWS